LPTHGVPGCSGSILPGEGDGVGILCRNHRGFFDITFGAAKVGARILYLNTDFAGAQLRDVCRREHVSLLVHDEEYADGSTSVVRRRFNPERVHARV
jgi:fatty-acyl-CoA synthase